MRNFLLLAAALMFGCGLCAHAHKLEGHLAEFHAVLPGLQGDNLQEAYRAICRGIDTDFGGVVSRHFHQPRHFNHRVIGHWGFQGNIPFNVEPWRSELAKYPRRELIRLWQEYTTKLVANTQALTGLPAQPAKGLTGLVYNLHLLGDREAGQVMVDAVIPTGAILKDLEKNLHSLFGKNSAASHEVVKALRGIPRGLPDAAKATRALEILQQAKLDERLMAQYGTALRSHRIQFTPHNAPVATREGIRRMSDFLRKPTVLTPQETPKAMRELASQKNVNSAPGMITKDGTLVVLTPSRVVRAAKTGLTYALVGLASDTAVASWRYLRHETWDEEFREELCNAVVRNVFIGTCVAVTVILGASPHGWCVLGVAVGAYLVVETAIHFWNLHQDKQFLTVGDLRGFGIVADTPLAEVDTMAEPPEDTTLRLPRETLLSL